MSNLVKHAERELLLAGMYEGEGTYNEMMANAVVELVQKFSEQGHSGTSAELTLQMFSRVANFKPLTPISSNPEEWQPVAGDMWQNTRRCSSFSRDGGKTWYDIDDFNLDNGDHWISNPIRRWRKSRSK